MSCIGNINVELINENFAQFESITNLAVTVIIILLMSKIII